MFFSENLAEKVFDILISLILLTITTFLLTGCARYRDFVAGAVKKITGQDGMTPLQKARKMRAQKIDTYVVEQETVQVPPLDEPPPLADYIVGPNDVLLINVSGKPEFSSLGSTTTTTTNLGQCIHRQEAGLTEAATFNFLFLGR